jgi:hypothetical protein
MKTLKIWVALLMLCIIVPTMAQAVDSYAYQANPRCEVKITLKTLDTVDPLTYRLTYAGAASKEGTLGPNETVDLLLPLSSQWYQLFIERGDAEQALYTLESQTNCNGFSASGIKAPPPVLNETQWAAARDKLKRFAQLAFGN